MDCLKSLRQLGQHIAQEQDAALTQMDLAPVRQKLLQEELPKPSRQRARARRRIGAAAMAGAAVAAAAALFLTLGPTREQDAPGLEVTVNGTAVEREALDNWWSAPSDAPLPIEFSDGTRVELSAKSRARVLQVGETGAHIVLESGSSSIEVVPRASSKWQVSAGPFLVQVVGTSFDIEWSPDEDLFVLKLRHGEVNLSGCLFGAGRSVVAGETVRAACKGRQYEIATRGSETAEKKQSSRASANAPAASVAPDENVATPVAPPPAPSWRTLARAGKYQEAVDAADGVGFTEAMTGANAEDLALLGDAARYAGEPGKAILAYERLRAAYPTTGRAATAAYSLARTHFDQRGAYVQATHWFQTYLRERPSGPLAREARGRLMESLNRSGNRQAARRIAGTYLKRYPTGPHAALARSLMSNKR